MEATLINFAQASEYISQKFPRSGFSLQSLYKLRRENPQQFPTTIKVGRSCYVDKDELFKFIVKKGQNKP